MDSPAPYLNVLALAHPSPKNSRGRNGVFTATRVEVYSRGRQAQWLPTCTDTPTGPPDPGFVSLDIYSARDGRQAPAALGLSLEDAVLVGAEIIRAAARALGYSAEQVAEIERAAQKGGPPGTPLPIVAADVLAQIRDVLQDDAGEWRELQSCADAVQEISLILAATAIGAPPVPPEEAPNAPAAP